MYGGKMSMLLAFLGILETTYGGRKTYPLKCSFCPNRDTFKIDKERAEASCYKYKNILKECPKFKVED
jgi:hypothetical protein